MYKRILVPIDGSRTAAKGLQEAIRLASGDKRTRICLLHIMDPLPAMQGMEVMITDQLIENMEAFGKKVLSKAKALVQKHGIGVDAVFQRQTMGRTSDAIVRQARKWRADVIVMGTHGRRGLTRIVLGSDAEGVVRLSPVPILLVRSGPAQKA